MTSSAHFDHSDVSPFGHEWNVTSLPFSPTAINDAGLIVGEQNGKAVRYRNGVVEVLPWPPGDAMFYGAVDVTSHGAILGKTDSAEGPAVLWRLLDGAPFPVSLSPPPVGFFVPAAVNRNLVVVGSSADAEVAYKWTPEAGYTPLIAPSGHSEPPTYATDVNNSGYIVGYIDTAFDRKAFLWEPNGARGELFGGERIGSHPYINSAGDVVAFYAQGFVNQAITVASLNGTVRSFPAIPEPLSVEGISDEGRLIGTSMLNGATRGWTFYSNQLTWLDPPPGIVGDSVQPTGVDRCGNIVGQVRQGFDVVGGLLFSKRFPPVQCDGSQVAHQ
jgi:hypothetical protein